MLSPSMLIETHSTIEHPRYCITTSKCKKWWCVLLRSKLSSKASNDGRQKFVGIGSFWMLEIGSILRWGCLHLPVWTIGTFNASHLSVGLFVTVGPLKSCQLNMPIGLAIKVGSCPNEAAHWTLQVGSRVLSLLAIQQVEDGPEPSMLDQLGGPWGARVPMVVETSIMVATEA